MNIIKIIVIVIGVYTLFYSLYWFVLTLLGNKQTNVQKQIPTAVIPEILIVLPAYKPGPVFFLVLDAVEKALSSVKSNVFVLLQEAHESYGVYAREKGFTVINKSFAHFGGNSYQHALRYIAHTIEQKREDKLWNPEFVMLVDKDNLIDPNFFNRISPFQFDQYDVIQGKRCAMSTDTPVAFFDSLTEKLNDTLYRVAKERMGMVIEISGSGALIETDLFLRCIQKLDRMAPGFDKNFMVQLLSEKRAVASTFLPQCALYEEKTASMDAHNPQRVRWFGEQYYNAIYHAKTLLSSLFVNKRLAALDYLITLCRPPRSLQVVLTPFAGALELIYFGITRTWIVGLPLFTVSAGLLMCAVLIFLIQQKVMRKAMQFSKSLFILSFNNFFNAASSIQKKNLGTFIHTTHKS